MNNFSERTKLAIKLATLAGKEIKRILDVPMLMKRYLGLNNKEIEHNSSISL